MKVAQWYRPVDRQLPNNEEKSEGISTLTLYLSDTIFIVPTPGRKTF